MVIEARIVFAFDKRTVVTGSRYKGVTKVLFCIKVCSLKLFIDVHTNIF